VPGENWRHPSEAELFWNRDLGGERPSASKSTTQPTSGPAAKFHGNYGFTPPDAKEMASVEGEAD
jgi:hypothetical protein